MDTIDCYTYPSIEYENSENSVSTQYSENFGKGYEWTWTNQLNYKNTFGVHKVEVLAGTEAIKDNGRGISGTRNGFYTYTNLSYINFNTATSTNSLLGGT